MYATRIRILRTKRYASANNNHISLYTTEHSLTVIKVWVYHMEE